MNDNALLFKSIFKSTISGEKTIRWKNYQMKKYFNIFSAMHIVLSNLIVCDKK